METKNCLIVGLPNAGKSTYIGAFWAIEKEGDTGHKLTCKEYPNDTSYLDALKMKWLNQQPMQRTTMDIPNEMSLKLRSLSSKEDVILRVPDFKGEIFQNILTNNVSKDVVKWCEEANSILYFIQKEPSDILQDEIGVSDNDSSQGNNLENIKMRIDDISYWIRNIMLLKYLHSKLRTTCKLAICLSAWDKVPDGEVDSAAQWMAVNEPFFFNFVNHHFSEVAYYGVSAQGVDYEDANKSFDEIQKLTDKRERAFVYFDKNNKSFDITEPIAYLISE